ncbi:MAG: PH domain-containing protein [Pirellulaceae bacterium]|nr:PH domain-containing protein [Pirellulaceae bacterium]
MTDSLNDSPEEGDETVEEHSVEEQPTGEKQPSVEPPVTALPPSQPSPEEHSVVRHQPLDPAFVTIERISGWIFTGCLLFAGLIGMGVVAFNFGLLSLITGICLLAYLLLGALLAWTTQVLPKKAHEHASWCLTPSGLEIRRGIWWRSQISVPLARVQHTDVHQGPLMRKFGLAKLTVHTAGTENSTVELNGLSFGTAQRLRDALIENRGELDGV